MEFCRGNAFQSGVPHVTYSHLLPSPDCLFVVFILAPLTVHWCGGGAQSAEPAQVFLAGLVVHLRLMSDAWCVWNCCSSGVFKKTNWKYGAPRFWKEKRVSSLQERMFWLGWSMFSFVLILKKNRNGWMLKDFSTRKFARLLRPTTNEITITSF